MQKRCVGVLMPVSMLPGKYGEGDFGEGAYRFVDFLAAGGFSVWQVLPFCLPDECHSPYKSYSSFSLNPNFIDLDTLEKKGLLTKEECASAKEKISYTCEFSRLDKERLPLLFRAAARVTDRAPINAFLAAHPDTAKFCRFMALRASNGDRHHTLWENERADEEVLRAWEFLSYEAYSEWLSLKAYANAHGVRIVGDLPIYVAEDSADVFFSPENFLLDEKGHPTEVAGVPLEAVTPTMRAHAKAVNFGLVYGISDFGLARNTGMSRKEAAAFIEKYFATYPGVRGFMDRAVKEGYETGMARTIFGRVRRLDELKSGNVNIRKFGERAAMNTPVQGTAADIIKLAMVRVHDALCQGGFRARLILQVHDELLIEAPQDEAGRVAQLLRDCMEHVAELSVPLVAEVKTGSSWYETK